METALTKEAEEDAATNQKMDSFWAKVDAGPGSRRVDLWWMFLWLAAGGSAKYVLPRAQSSQPEVGDLALRLVQNHGGGADRAPRTGHPA